MFHMPRSRRHYNYSSSSPFFLNKRPALSSLTLIKKNFPSPYFSLRWRNSQIFCFKKIVLTISFKLSGIIRVLYWICLPFWFRIDIRLRKARMGEWRLQSKDENFFPLFEALNINHISTFVFLTRRNFAALKRSHIEIFIPSVFCRDSLDTCLH